MRRNKINVTDESQALEILGHECAVVRGKPYNIKITEDIDLNHAKALTGETGILTYDINWICKQAEESND